MMLLAVGFLSLMDAGLKDLSAAYPAFEDAALRAAASWPIVAVWVFTQMRPSALLRVRWSLHLLRGALGVMMIGAFVYGVRELPLTAAYTLFFVAPLIITLLAKPFLGEAIGPHRWIAIVGGFIGVLVALRPDVSGVVSWASLAVLVAALGYAVSAITVRVLARTDGTPAMVFWMLTLTGLGAALLALPDWVPVRSEHWLVVAGVGLTGALGQYTITEAFVRGEASVLAPLEYTALLWGLAFDALLWHVLPGSSTWIGAAIIVGCGIYLIRAERSQAAQLATSEPSVQP